MPNHRCPFPHIRLLAVERLVELTGEGYFEVARNTKQPFVVATALQRVTVLGTHFNVQAYADQAHTSTTLLEGSVQVSGKAGRSLLAPGEQCRLNGQTGGMQKLQVDTEEVVAWKNGYFYFQRNLSGRRTATAGPLVQCGS